MQLLADRFVLSGDRTALDLATGERVALAVEAAGSASEQRQWLLACDAAAASRHPAIAPLVDYGLVGGSRRFEAHRIIAAESGLRIDGQMPSIAIVSRPAVAAIAELFERSPDVRPRLIGLWGPRGAGRHTVVGDLARIARLQGFVPVAARLLGVCADALRGRSLLVIDESDGGVGRSAWLAASLRTSRPHVLLCLSVEQPSLTDAVAIEPVPVDALVRAVQPAIEDAARIAALRRFAEQSLGWPSRFARLVWGQSGAIRASTADSRRHADLPPQTVSARRSTGSLRAAEQPATYGVEEPGAALATCGGPPPLPADIARWRGRIESGIRLVAEGRHAHAERMLRQAIGASARRDKWADAGDGSLALAQLLIHRGRAADAQVLLIEAADFWRQAGAEPRLIDVAVLTATTWLELGRLDQAETAASAAATAARSLGDEARAAGALAILARTLFWRGRYHEAELTWRSAAGTSHGGTKIAATGNLDVPIAVGLGDLARAVSRGTEALIAAQHAAEPRLVAQAAKSAAFAHLAVGDLAAVERDVAASIAAARACREPLTAVRSRLILVEALRRAGKRPAALGLLQRVSRIGSTQLPAIVRARCDLLRDLLAAASDADEVVNRHVSVTGLGALALYGGTLHGGMVGGSVARAGNRQAPQDPMVAAIVEILDLCQTSDDERAVLTEVCRRLRVQLHAAGTTFVADEGGARVAMVADGGRIDQAIVTRAIAAGVTVAPHRCGDRLEAAAPIRLAGVVIGAIAARWTVGTPHDLGAAASLMTTVAAATAPILSAAVARERRLSVPAMADILGASAAMAEVRRGVERAAPAPFAVLIEGESGSGKELVARALHRSGPRRNRPLCTLNCAALPDDLVEAELFGHARGAFTGAVGERAGVFEEAHGGTLLLDEIGELSPRAQAKVLRVIQEGELRRVGDNASRRVDVRIVSATNRDLRQEVTAGRFRLDLLYRLDVVRIAVPPLRERREDIPGLIAHFWQEATARVGSRATLAPATLAAFGRYDWPGNVRELQNALASLAVRAARRGVVPRAALGPQFADQRLADALRLEDARRTFEEQFVRAALVRAGGRRVRAAEELGVTRQGLTKLMARLGISA